MLGDQHARCKPLRRVAGLDRDFGLAEHLAGVELLGDEWTVQPVTVSPAASARSWVSRPLYLGSSEGWMLTIRPRQRSMNQGERMRMKPASAMVPTRWSSSAALERRSNVVLVDALAVPASRSEGRASRAQSRPGACGLFEATSTTS